MNFIWKFPFDVLSNRAGYTFSSTCLSMELAQILSRVLHFEGRAEKDTA